MREQNTSTVLKNQLLKEFRDGILSLELSPDISSKIEEQFQKLAVKCNKCASPIISDDPNHGWRGVISVSESWGYESTGKDMSHDNWTLCDACSSEFRQKYSPVCSGCRRSVTEVMALLDSRNQNSSLYGRFDAAMDRLRDSSKHCGIQYATIDGCIFCEICYEQFVSNFKVAFSADYFDDETKSEPFVHTNRVDRATNLWEPENTKILPWESLLIARKAPDASERIVSLRYREEHPEHLEYLKARGHDVRPEISIQTGDGKHKSIHLEDLQKELTELGLAVGRTSWVEFCTLAIVNDGLCISHPTNNSVEYADYVTIDSALILALCDKYAQPL